MYNSLKPCRKANVIKIVAGRKSFSVSSFQFWETIVFDHLCKLVEDW